MVRLLFLAVRQDHVVVLSQLVGSRTLISELKHLFVRAGFCSIHGSTYRERSHEIIPVWNAESFT